MVTDIKESSNGGFTNILERSHSVLLKNDPIEPNGFSRSGKAEQKELK